MTICFTLPYSGPVKRELNLIFWQQLLNAPSWLQLSPEANVAHQARARAKILPLPLYHRALSLFSLDYNFFLNSCRKISLHWFKDCLRFFFSVWFLLAVALQDAGWMGEQGDKVEKGSWATSLWSIGSDCKKVLLMSDVSVMMVKQLVTRCYFHFHCSQKQAKKKG